MYRSAGIVKHARCANVRPDAENDRLKQTEWNEISALLLTAHKTLTTSAISVDLYLLKLFTLQLWNCMQQQSCNIYATSTSFIWIMPIKGL